MINRTGCVYKVSCTTNEMFLIGSTGNFKRRKELYLWTLKRNEWKNPLLQNVYNKYGKDSLRFTVLQDNIPEEILASVEDIWIGALKARVEDKLGGMNIRDAQRFRPSEETIAKIRKTCRETSPYTKTILKYSLGGRYICSYKGTREVVEKVGGSLSQVSRVCGLKCTKPYLGFQWRYKNTAEIPLTIPPAKKAILAISPDGVTTEYISIMHASKTLRFDWNNIKRHLLASKPFKGYYFKYFEYDKTETETM